ncbi:skin secretory protein xP2-like [Penaeus monodon]|uniref:skin secretory protein xP2-like n=1 Tax=Penaeus monodon TaxID=6687 RepID=UPI0018A6D860|nr:skin secretory protein xP2-like [Penaeus monodon]
MRQLVVIGALLGVALAMPQRGLGPDNTFTKILSFESYQDGNQFGHQLLQEDGTASGQKFGQDGLLYGFYSYVQDDGNPVKVLWRAGKGVGYEVLGVEGISQDGLGNLRAHTPTGPQTPAAPRPAAPRPAAPRAAPRPVAPPPRPVVPAPPPPPPQPAFRPQPARAAPAHFVPTAAPALFQEPTPAPHRFDYPATLNLERTAHGFVSSLTAQ